VALHRHRTDPQPLGDLARGVTLGKQRQHLELAARERGDAHAIRSSPVIRMETIDHRRELFVGKHDFPGGRAADRVDDRVVVRRNRHQTACAGSERGGRQRAAPILAGREQPDVRPRLPKARHDVEPATVASVEVHDRDIDRSSGDRTPRLVEAGDRTEDARGRGLADGEQERLGQSKPLTHYEHTNVAHPSLSIGTRPSIPEWRVPHPAASERLESMTDRPMNRLAGETSPYLLQHAHNPVDWYPWGDEAFEKARADDRPVFLSVGYAACHWCHVMERESFEDPETAAALNDGFVSIKVDREERPDVDGVYMDAVQALTGGGGWPMSVWLTPDGRPFYAGTYYPPEPRHGLPSFRQVLQGLTEAWSTRRDEIEAQSAKLVEAIGSAGRLEASADTLTRETEREAFTSLQRAFDAEWGGFGSSPKFPQPMVLEFVLRMALRGTPDAMEMLVLTLDRMSAGGMYDQIGGGFSRYSTDRGWNVPHFEKMLYDNAQLASLYTHAWLVTRDEELRRVATDTLEYLLREMRHPDGGFFSSLDADSEGVEGKFFTWSWDELVGLVGEPVSRAFGATPTGNWEGTNILRRPARDVQDDVRELFEAREKRIRPGVDDKILTAWNALAIRAFAEAGRAFGEPAFVQAASACAVFVWKNLRGSGGRLLRSWREGMSGPPGYADDYALLASALLTLYETTSDLRWFEAARALCDSLMELFADDDRGGFFQTGRDAERLVIRPKDLYDNAVPSGNSAAAEALQRMALFTGEAAYEKEGVSAIRLVREAMAQAPTVFGSALCALDLYVGPAHEVAIVGEPGAPDTLALLDEVTRVRFLPNVVLAVGAADEESARIVPLMADRVQVDDKATAYVCERFVCRMPVVEGQALAEQLSDAGR